MKKWWPPISALKNRPVSKAEGDIVGGNVPNAKTPRDKPGAIAGHSARLGAPGLAIRNISFSDLTWCFTANVVVL